MVSKASYVLAFVAIISTFILSLASYAQDSSSPSELIPELITEVNLWRLSQGLEPLVYNETLEAMAISQAEFLITLPSIPVTSIHTGRQGESARQRSQFPEFQWPNYGNPRRFAVSEIAAIGSIRSAMGFWTTSETHTNSVLNPTYREVGIAARQLGSDVLFIVVLGGQPDVLPALSNPTTGELYLTTERNEWRADADWMGEAVRYRFLDADETPISEFAEWQQIVSLPEQVDNFFYVEYEDANGKRVTYEVPVYPSWYTGDEPVIPTDVPTATQEPTQVQSGLFATNTPVGVAMASTDMPTMMPSPTMILPTPTLIPPTATPIIQQGIQLIYTDTHFTLLNASTVTINVFEVSFRNGDNSYDALRWEAPMADLDVSAFPANHCLQIGGVNTSNTVAPIDACRWIRSFITLNESRFFWTEGEFEVLNRGVVVATCSASAGVCDVLLDD